MEEDSGIIKTEACVLFPARKSSFCISSSKICRKETGTSCSEEGRHQNHCTQKDCENGKLS